MTNGHRRIFAGTELAARIERAERSLIAESALAAGRRDPGGRCFATTLAGGVAAWAGELPENTHWHFQNHPVRW
jgi:hypothetical protein